MEVVASSDSVMGQVEGDLGNADNESVPENQVSALKDQESRLLLKLMMIL